MPAVFLTNLALLGGLAALAVPIFETFISEYFKKLSYEK